MPFTSKTIKKRILRSNDMVRIRPFTVTLQPINGPYTAVFGEVTVKIWIAVSIDLGRKRFLWSNSNTNKCLCNGECSIWS